MFWYKTPHVIHKYDPSVFPRCWRCRTDIGSLFHIFWECSLIQPFWYDVSLLIQKVVNVFFPLDPLNCLLGLPISGLAAKRLIPLCWLSSTPPSWFRFLHLVAETQRMEFPTASVHDSIPQFTKVWEPWDLSEYGTHVPTTTSKSTLT